MVKQTLKSYRAAYENELWLLGQKAVDQGYADEVVTVKCDATMVGTRIFTTKMFGLSFQVNYSKCPTNTAVLSVDVKVETTKGTMLLADFLAKGGVFGSECYKQSSNYSIVPPLENSAPLCLIDVDLTLASIKAGIKEVIVESNKSKADKVHKSY